MNTTFKIVNVNTRQAVATNLDFYQAMYRVNGYDELCVMSSDDDIDEMLQRRDDYIKATEELVEA